MLCSHYSNNSLHDIYHYLSIKTNSTSYVIHLLVNMLVIKLVLPTAKFVQYLLSLVCLTRVFVIQIFVVHNIILPSKNCISYKKKIHSSWMKNLNYFENTLIKIYQENILENQNIVLFVISTCAYIIILDISIIS